MDKMEDRRKKANLKRYLRDFPWLWAILQSWHHWQVEIRVHNSSTLDLARLIYFPDKEIQIWVKAKNNLMGKDVPSEEMIDITPKIGQYNLVSLVAATSSRHLIDVEFVILVSIGNGNKYMINIFRPPNSQRFW